MTLQAMVWALEEASIPKELPKGWPSRSALTLVLLGMANHAQGDGTGCYASVYRISLYARLDERTVRRCIRALEELGLISQGNQRIAAAITEHVAHRPVVYNLSMETGGEWSPRVIREREAVQRRQERYQRLEGSKSRGGESPPQGNQGGRPVPSGGASDPFRGGESPPEPKEEPKDEPEGGLPKVPDSLAADAQNNPPPPRCDAHDGMDDAPPCRACARVREQREATEREHRARAAERHRLERQRAAELISAAIAECDLCDSNGYAGLEVCTHDPLLSVTRDRGLTALYAAMGWDRKGPEPDEEGAV